MGFLVRDTLARVVASSPRTLFTMLTQSTDVSAWWRGVASTLEGPSPWAQGTRLTLRAALRRPLWISEIKEVLQDQLVEVYYTGGDFSGAASWEFEPVGQGARVVHRWLGVEPTTHTGRALFFTLGHRVHAYLYNGALLGMERLSA